MDKSQLVERFEKFVSVYYHKQLLENLRKGMHSLVIDFEKLDEFDKDLGDSILGDLEGFAPEDTIIAFEDSLQLLDLPTKEKIHVRFINLPDSKKLRIKDLRSKHLGKFVVVEGLIRQASEVRPEAVEVVFECLDCGNKIAVLQTGVAIKRPARCICGKKSFKEDDKTFHDVQSLTLEESPEMLEGGEQASRISVVLMDDLVEPEFREKVTPGNHISVAGILKELPQSLASGSRSKRYEIYLQSNFLTTIIQEFEKMEISKEDEAKIIELSKDPAIKDKLVDSIAPSIYGHKEIKGAIALQLFGAVAKERKDKVRTRGDIHILLVGDPGSGKSALLKYVSHLAPKGIYVSGMGTSAAGLTAAVVRDEFLKGWALEAGALVLANKGIAMIDEIDKMNKDDRVAMHEAMEQQTVSIAKANIHATLRSQTSILAAANPKYSRFDPYQPIGEQIELPVTLLSRFDLIFPIKDTPSKDRDERLAEHILHLQKEPESITASLDTALLRKYIAYAKRHVEPKLSTEALEEIKAFYLGLRSKYQGEETNPTVSISPRQLEGLVRLAEASAKMHLSPIVTRDDARTAIDLMKFCLYQIGTDPETGKLDIDRLEGGMPSSRRSKIPIVLEILRDLEKVSKTIPRQRVYDAAKIKGIDNKEVDKILDELKRVGDIFEPRFGEIQVL